MAKHDDRKRIKRKVIEVSPGKFVKAGGALDTSSGEGKARLRDKRVAAARKKITGDLKTRVVALQKKTPGARKGELSLQKDTAPKQDAIKNEPTQRGLKKAFEGAAAARAEAKKKIKTKGT
jgi:hypothetical protein